MLKVCVVHLSFVFHFLFPLRHPHESCTAGSSCCYLLQLHIEQFAISCDSFHISQASFSMLFQKKKKKSSFTCKVLKNLSFQGEHLGESSCLVILANHFIFFHFLTRKSKSVSDKRVIELLEDSGKICCILLPCCQE